MPNHLTPEELSAEVGIERVEDRAASLEVAKLDVDGVVRPVAGDHRLRGGRIESPVSFAYTVPGSPNTFRRDVNGEVQHIEAGVQYEFPEVYGSTGLFAGIGLYRQSGANVDSTTNFGASFGVNADFPITRRYGIVLDGTYHWVRTDFQPRFLTVGAGVITKVID